MMHRFEKMMGWSVFILVGLTACSTNKAGSGQASSAALFQGENPFAQAATINLESVKATHASRFKVFFSGNVTGETEPCGCAVNPKGGLDRRLNYITAATKESPYPYLIVDAGNVLFPNEKMDKSQEAAQRARAALLLKGDHLMNISAQNVGYLDLTAGVDFLKNEAEKNQVKLVSANWVDSKGNLLFTPMMTFDLGREKAVIIGLSRGFKTDKPAKDAPTVLDPIITLEKRLATIAEDQPVIVLSDLGSEMDRELALKIKRGLIIIGSRDLSSIEIPIHEGASILLQGQLQGQQWGSIEVGWKPKAASWYNVGVGMQFNTLWQKNAESYSLLAVKPDSDEKAEELKILESAQKDMMRFVPGNLDEKQVYEYKLVDMSIEFAKSNELTPLMDQIKKLK